MGCIAPTYVARSTSRNSFGKPGAALVYKRPPCRRVTNQSSGCSAYERRLPLLSVTLPPGLIARPPPRREEEEEKDKQEGEEKEKEEGGGEEEEHAHRSHPRPVYEIIY